MSIRVVFMGTPEFAVAPLEALIQNNMDVVGVVTVPDKPAGRGMQLQASAVKQCALRHGIPVLQPEKLRNETFLMDLAALQADLFVVVAFRMLPEVVFRMPRLGTFNLHGSLLPQYRGAAPIHWAVIQGEHETGVTTFFIDKDIDTGHVIAYAKTPIGPDETTGEVHDRLMQIGADLVVKTVQQIEDGHCKTVPQTELAGGETLKPAPKIFKEDCKIDWSCSAEKIHNFIRGLSPFPCAFTQYKKGDQLLLLKIYKARIVNQQGTNEPEINHTGTVPGSLFSDGKHLWVQLTDGKLEVLDLQLQGKKRMPVQEFLKGFKIDNSDYLV